MSAVAATSTGAPRCAGRARHYHGPDILRLIAAGLVVLFHVSEMGGRRPSWPVEAAIAPLGWLAPIGWMGWIGVQMFFVLSGFVISASAVNSSPLAFLKKRAIRIYPALWISCVVSLAARAAWGEPLAELFPALLRSAVLSPKGPYLDGVVWSLIVEAAFYLVVAAALALALSTHDSGAMLLRTAYVIGFSSSLFAVIHGIAVRTAGHDQLVSAMGSFAFDIALLRQGMFFAIGILLFHLVDHKPTRTTIIALALFTLAACLQIADTVAGRGNPAVPIMLWAAVSALMFASVKFPASLPATLNPRVSRQLGLMTYPLYLNHFVLAQALLPLLAVWLPSVIVFPVLVALLLANAWLIAMYPERWVQRWLDNAIAASNRKIRRFRLRRLAS